MKIKKVLIDMDVCPASGNTKKLYPDERLKMICFDCLTDFTRLFHKHEDVLVVRCPNCSSLDTDIAQ